jgi:hypothetical protein
MAQGQAFQPVTTTNAVFGNSIAVTIAATNTTAALPFTINNGSSLRVYNSSSVAIAITTGISAATAVAVFPVNGTPAAGLVIAPGGVEVFTIPPNAAFVGVIGASASGSLAYFTQGEGL